MTSRPAPFVADTHVLWWYLKSPYRLSATVADILQSAAVGNAVIIIPAIVAAEFYFLSVKENQPTPPYALIQDLASVVRMELSDLGIAQLALLERLPEIADIHDRLIAAEALHRQAPLLTRDRTLQASTQLATIW